MADASPEQVCVLSKREESSKVTDREETETPEVFTVTWMPDDHISELTYILQGEFNEGSCMGNYYFDSNEQPVNHIAIHASYMLSGNHTLVTAAAVDVRFQAKACATYILAMQILQTFIAIYNQYIVT